MTNLNPNQKAAATAPDRPLLIVAGAGTGKTRTLTMRIIHLLERGVSPANICALTFTNKAAREIEDRVLTAYARANDSLQNSNRKNWAGEPPFLGTFHSFGSRLLRKEARHFGRTIDYVIYDDQDSLSLIKRIVKSLGLSLKGRVREGFGRGEERGPAYFAVQIGQIKNGMTVLPPPLDRNPEEEILGTVFEAYERELQKNNAFDFDDLIEKVVILFRKHPEVLTRYQERYTHFLIDEYQDVNSMQYSLVRMLAQPSGNISVVGDLRQLIYGWRGSNIEIFLNFERDWPEAQIISLDQNYRSTQCIINSASALMDGSRIKKMDRLWTANPRGEKMRLIETIDDEEEADWIANEIVSLRKENSNIEKADDGKRGTAENTAHEKSIAILYRTNAQSRAIEQAFLRRNIPYFVYGGLKFYERKEIRDVVAALRYALNAGDTVSQERLEKSLNKGKLRDFAAAIAAKPSRVPIEVITVFMTSTGYLEYVGKSLTNLTDREENIAALVEFASGYNDLAPLLEEITLLQSTDAIQKTKNGRRTGRRTASEQSGAQTQTQPVQLMTMHLAKGLEFDAVFIAGATEGLLPHARSRENDAELEEERRLMYVAMTRAKELLTVSFYDIPSRFLSEIPEELVVFKSLVSDTSAFEDDEGRYITYD
ncbi:MAG: UvrD-helicase domain-containing protein [Candidatus Liptonbacteria bacterium]